MMAPNVNTSYLSTLIPFTLADQQHMPVIRLRKHVLNMTRPVTLATFSFSITKKHREALREMRKALRYLKTISHRDVR